MIGCLLTLKIASFGPKLVWSCVFYAVIVVEVRQDNSFIVDLVFLDLVCLAGFFGKSVVVD